MGFFFPNFLFLLFFHTNSKSLQHNSTLTFQIWKRSHFYLSYLKRELKCDEGAFNLEEQTNFNEVWMNLYVQALFRPVPMPSSVLSIWILILVSYFNSSGPSYHNLFLLEEIANTKKCIIETFEKSDTFPLILIPISLKHLNIASYYFYYHVCVRVVHLAPHAKRCTSWDNEKKAYIIWEKSRL